MSAKAVVLRRAARHDIDEAIDFYIGRKAYDAAYRLVDELEKRAPHDTLRS